MDAQYELASEKGAIKHAALTLYGYYCKLRSSKTGLCFPKPPGTSKATGIPRTNVIMLTKFLDEQNWIHIYGTGLIRPLKGFYSEAEIFQIKIKELLRKPFSCLIIRQICLINRQTCLMIRQLFKGSINQPIEPAQLTSFSQNPRNANSATATTADKKFDKFEPAEKPTPRQSPASPQKPALLLPPASAEKPADERIEHPAVKMVKEITGRYPPKDQWDKIIREISLEPDIEFFRAAWEIWRSFDGNRMNLQGWLFLPNERGKLPEVYGRTSSGGDGIEQNGKSPPPGAADADFEIFEAEPLTAEAREIVLSNFREMPSSLEWVRPDSYTPEDWAYFQEQLKNGGKRIYHDKKLARPSSRGEALRQIEATYKLNDWKDAEQARNVVIVGLEAKPVGEYSNAELKIILDDFENRGMILFEN